MTERISRKQIADGLEKPVACCMFDVKNRVFKCNMWLDIYDEVSEIGFLAYEENNLIGQLIFLPKKYAKKICIPTCKASKRFETTIVIGCLLIIKDYRNKGIATLMIKQLIDFCNDNGYSRIEVGISLKPSGNKPFEKISFLPFKKFGFIIDQNSSAFEFNDETKMSYCDLLK